MQSFLVRLFLVLFVSIFQISVLSVAFPSFTPQAVLVMVVSWTLILGFTRVWPWVIALGFFMDIFSLGILGVTPFLLLMVSYVSGFFSKRFLVEHRGLSTVVLGVSLALGALWYRWMLVFMESAISGNFAWKVYFQTMAGFSWQAAFWTGLMSALLFFFVHPLLSRIERSLAVYDVRISLKS